jgi:hypothetical protein
VPKAAVHPVAEAISLFAIALVIGAISSALGLGGGVFFVPFLALSGMAASMQIAAGASLLAVASTGVSGSLAYARSGAINYRLVIGMLLPTAAAAWYGAFLSSAFSSRSLGAAFGVFLIYPALSMLLDWRPRITRAKGQPEDTIELRLVIVAAIGGAAAGFLAGLLGMGGGPLLVPLLVLVVGLTPREGAATSLLVMVPSAIAASMQHILAGNALVLPAAPLAAGALIGSQLGPRIAARIPHSVARRAFGALMLGVSARMIVESFS